MKTENSGDKCRSNGMVHTSQLPENPYQNQVVNTGINGQCQLGLIATLNIRTHDKNKWRTFKDNIKTRTSPV